MRQTLIEWMVCPVCLKACRRAEPGDILRSMVAYGEALYVTAFEVDKPHVVSPAFFEQYYRAVEMCENCQKEWDKLPRFFAMMGERVLDG